MSCLNITYDQTATVCTEDEEYIGFNIHFLEKRIKFLILITCFLDYWDEHNNCNLSDSSNNGRGTFMILKVHAHYCLKHIQILNHRTQSYQNGLKNNILILHHTTFLFLIESCIIVSLRLTSTLKMTILSYHQR